MKKRTCYFILIALISILSGCSNKKNVGPDSYVEGTDYQYMFHMSLSNGESGFQKNDGTVYFRQNDYLYCVDEELKKVIPICNKANCLHDAENSEEKKNECMAYMPDSSGIFYNDGWLYFLADQDEIVKNDDGEYCIHKTSLYRLKEDGSTRDKLYTWSETQLDHWLIHRGRAYYVKHNYQVGEKGDANYVSENYQVACLSLDKKKENIIFPEKDEIIGIDDIWAYGNHLYFSVSWEDDNTGTGGMDLYTKDLLSKESPAIVTINDHSVSLIGFQKDRMLCTLYMEEGYRRLFSVDLVGNDPQIVIDQIPKYTGIYADDKNLFATNLLAVNIGMTDEPTRQEKLDSEGNELFSFHYDEEFVWEPLTGDANGLYYLEGDFNSQDYVLWFWDKSTLSSSGAAVFEKYLYSP